MASVRGTLFADFGTKVMSVILALAVYVHVFSGREQEMSYRVPLEISPLPSGLMIASGVPPDVRVRVRASGKDLLKLKTRPFSAEITIDSPRAGTLQRPILGTDFKMPRGVRISSVEVLDPRALNLSIERVGSRMVPVAARVREGPGDDRALLERPATEPRSVRMTGPASLIASIDSAETEPISLGRETDLEVAIVLPPGVTAEPQQVGVQLATDERHTRRFSGISIGLSPLQKDRLLWIQPAEVQVVLTGAASIIDPISQSRIFVTGDIGKATIGAQHLHLRAYVTGLPKGVPVGITCIPDSASVRLQ